MTSLDDATLLRIYDTIPNQSLWPDVLEEIAGNVGAKGAIMFEWQGAASGERNLHAHSFTSFFSADTIAAYIHHCGAQEARDQDVFESHSLRHDGIDLMDDSILAPTLDALRQRKNVQVLERCGILHRAAGLLNKDNTAFGRFSVQLGAETGPLKQSARAYLGKVLPHVAKAIDLGRPIDQLATKYDSMLAAMNRLQIGLCILDDQSRVMARNEEFDRQAQEYPVFRIDPNGVLILQSPEDAKTLEALKSHARVHGQFGARPRKEALRTNHDSFLCIELAPLTRLEEAGSAPLEGYMLMSTDTRRPFVCNTAPIAKAFDLTPTEASLIDAIARGLTNAQIAEERGRSLPTINTQVKSILAKTDCATRTQLVRVMISFGVEHLVGDTLSP